MGQNRRRAKHAARRRDDRELDMARAAGGQKLLEQGLGELAAGDDDPVDVVDDLMEPCMQVSATLNPAADLGVDVGEELELP